MLGDEILQDGLLRLRHSVELVDVDERITRHGEEDVVVVLHRQTVVEIDLQILRQQTAAEGGLTRALRTDKQGDDGIAVLTVLAEPLGYHREHPGMEVTFPMRIISLYPAGQLTYIVMFAVPTGQVLDVVFHRIILRNQI